MQEQEREGLRHFLRIGECITGKRVYAEYRYSISDEGSRNKFSSLYESYSALLEYIESHLLVISLQIDDDIYDSLYSLIRHNANFE